MTAVVTNWAKPSDGLLGILISISMQYLLIKSIMIVSHAIWVPKGKIFYTYRPPHPFMLPRSGSFRVAFQLHKIRNTWWFTLRWTPGSSLERIPMTECSTLHSVRKQPCETIEFKTCTETDIWAACQVTHYQRNGVGGRRTWPCNFLPSLEVKI